jgi:hypothetical protein
MGLFSTLTNYFGWCLGGVTFNLNLTGQVEKTTQIACKNQFLCAVGWEDILRWNSILKPCKDRIDLQNESVPE